MTTPDDTLIPWQRKHGQWDGKRLVCPWGKSCCVYRFLTYESSVCLVYVMFCAYVQPQLATRFQLVMFWTVNAAWNWTLTNTTRKPEVQTDLSTDEY